METSCQWCGFFLLPHWRGPEIQREGVCLTCFLTCLPYWRLLSREDPPRRGSEDVGRKVKKASIVPPQPQGSQGSPPPKMPGPQGRGGDGAGRGTQWDQLTFHSPPTLPPKIKLIYFMPGENRLGVKEPPTLNSSEHLTQSLLQHTYLDKI